MNNKFVLARIETDDGAGDVLMWIDVDSPLLETLWDDGENLLYLGDRILDVYEMEGCGIWRDSIKMYHNLVDQVKTR
mgnify:CR=1 FL=1